MYPRVRFIPTEQLTRHTPGGDITLYVAKTSVNLEFTSPRSGDDDDDVDTESDYDPDDG